MDFWWTNIECYPITLRMFIAFSSETQNITLFTWWYIRIDVRSDRRKGVKHFIFLISVSSTHNTELPKMNGQKSEAHYAHQSKMIPDNLKQVHKHAQTQCSVMNVRTRTVLWKINKSVPIHLSTAATVSNHSEHVKCTHTKNCMQRRFYYTFVTSKQINRKKKQIIFPLSIYSIMQLIRRNMQHIKIDNSTINYKTNEQSTFDFILSSHSEAIINGNTMAMQWSDLFGRTLIKQNINNVWQTFENV